FAQRSATGSSAARLMFGNAGAQPRPLRRRVLRGSLGRSRRQGGQRFVTGTAYCFALRAPQNELTRTSRPRERSERATSAASRIGEVGRERLVAAKHTPAAGRGSLPLSKSSDVDAA